MDMQKTGQLIRRLRETRGVTQKVLAGKLHITDKAVSKWERGLSCPDVALLEPLAEQLDISVAELLQGELFQGAQPQDALLPQNRLQEEQHQGKQDESFGSSCSPGDNSPQREKRRFSMPGRSGLRPLHILQRYAFFACTLLFCTGGVICAICDLAVFGAFTWSLYPIASLIFAWTVLSPLLRHGVKGIPGCLASLSAALFPFLFALAWLLHMPPLFLPIGLRMAVIGLAFLWGIYWILHQWAPRRLFALALCGLLAVLTHLAVNFVLSRLIQTPFLDGWDVLTIAVFLCMAVSLLLLDQKVGVPHRCTEDSGETS